MGVAVAEGGVHLGEVPGGAGKDRPLVAEVFVQVIDEAVEELDVFLIKVGGGIAVLFPHIVGPFVGVGRELGFGRELEFKADGVVREAVAGVVPLVVGEVLGSFCGAVEMPPGHGEGAGENGLHLGGVEGFGGEAFVIGAAALEVGDIVGDIGVIHGVVQPETVPDLVAYDEGAFGGVFHLAVRPKGDEADVSSLQSPAEWARVAIDGGDKEEGDDPRIGGDHAVGVALFDDGVEVDFAPECFAVVPANGVEVEEFEVGLGVCLIDQGLGQCVAGGLAAVVITEDDGLDEEYVAAVGWCGWLSWLSGVAGQVSDRPDR